MNKEDAKIYKRYRDHVKQGSGIFGILSERDERGNRNYENPNYSDLVAFYEKHIAALPELEKAADKVIKRQNTPALRVV